MTKISGGARHRAVVRKLQAESRAVVRTQLFVAANMIEVEAVRSITEGSVSGKNHVPSAPGEPPNADTNTLDNSIQSELTSDTTAEVYADADHAVAQEYGAVIDDGFGKGVQIVLEERPYMRPAAAKKGLMAATLIRAGLRKIIREGGA